MVPGQGILMEVGKVSENILKRSVFKQLHNKREEVVLGPSVGEDCAMVQFGPDDLCVLSTDPITGTTKDIGTLAVHITMNDLASNGAEPIGIMVTLLLPDGFAEEELRAIMQDMDKACADYNIQVLGGHTEVTKAVNQPLITITGVGKANKNKRIINSEASADMDIVMTKWAGLEGTAIISAEKESELRAKFYGPLVDRALDHKNYISVLPESRIALENGAVAMHDATEGGVFGALWELGASAGVGMAVDLELIPLKQETIEICEHFDINPYKLISSGVLLIITDQGRELVEALKAEGIDGTVIGRTTDKNDREVIQGDSRRALTPAAADELYKVL